MKLSIQIGKRDVARAAGESLRKSYGHVTPQEADVIVAVGGDGTMLEVLRANMHLNKPVYGLNRGTVGFLMNSYNETDLVGRIERAETAVIHPLSMRAYTGDGQVIDELAINEISLYRQTRQSAKLRISVNDKVRMESLTCDGVLIATPAGSTAYNLSAHGPILPLEARMLALTPISAFRPRRWKGALLSHQANVRIDVLDPEHRAVSAVADNSEVRDVVRVDATENRQVSMKILFDEGQSLEERILSEQFDF